MLAGTEVQRQQLGECLFSTLGAMGNDENATQVLQKALIHAPQKVALARALVPQLAQIARGRLTCRHHVQMTSRVYNSATKRLSTRQGVVSAVATLSKPRTVFWSFAALVRHSPRRCSTFLA